MGAEQRGQARRLTWRAKRRKARSARASTGGGGVPSTTGTAVVATGSEIPADASDATSTAPLHVGQHGAAGAAFSHDRMHSEHISWPAAHTLTASVGALRQITHISWPTVSGVAASCEQAW